MTHPALRIIAPLLLALALPLACTDDGGSDASTTETSGDGDGDATTTTTGDGDGDATTTTGDGDGDETTTTGDGDGDPATGDGDGDGDPKPEAPPCPYDAVNDPGGIEIDLVAGGYVEPVLVVGHPTEPDQLYVVERIGNVIVTDMNTGEKQAEPFLSVNPTTIVEYGLLGFDFHPYYPDDPRVYVNYNPAGEDMTRVSEFTVDLDTNTVVDGSERIIIELHQPAPNHNGGGLEFGPDDYLYIGLGDGGGANDTFDTGRDFSVLQAKMLRIDVEPTGNADKDPVSCQGCPTYGPFDYGIPADNPFVDDPNIVDEAWALGMRNPYRYSFDIETGDLYVADVGQDAFEEIAVVEAGTDHGWSDMEGFACFFGANCIPGTEQDNAGQTNADGLTYPIHAYNHSNNNCSVTGGNVYRSCQVPSWSGTYFFADYCNGRVDALTWDGSTTTVLSGDGEILDTPVFSNVLGFGGNAWGDVFIAAADGNVYRIVPG